MYIHRGSLIISFLEGMKKIKSNHFTCNRKKMEKQGEIYDSLPEK